MRLHDTAFGMDGRDPAAPVKAESAADPYLQAVWATCSHDDYIDICTFCEYRKLALIEYLDALRWNRSLT